MKALLKSKLVWLLLIAAIGGAGAFFSTLKKNNESLIGTVTREDLTQRVNIAGTVNPKRRTFISAPYNGYVRKLYVRVGDHVKPGDPVVSLAQSLRNTEEDVYPMRAPFAGTVVQSLKTEGEYVEQSSQGGNAIVRIDDITRLFIEANSPENEVGKLKLGQEVIIKAAAVLGRTYKGKIQHISLAAKEQRDWDKSRVEFPVMIEVLDQDKQIMPGMSVIIDIIANRLEQVLTLRHEFIQKEENRYFVVTEKGEKKPITVGLQNEEVFEIKSGVIEGERIRQTDFLSILKER